MFSVSPYDSLFGPCQCRDLQFLWWYWFSVPERNPVACRVGLFNAFDSFMCSIWLYKHQCCACMWWCVAVWSVQSEQWIRSQCSAHWSMCMRLWIWPSKEKHQSFLLFEYNLRFSNTLIILLICFVILFSCQNYLLLLLETGGIRDDGRHETSKQNPSCMMICMKSQRSLTSTLSVQFFWMQTATLWFRNKKGFC